MSALVLPAGYHSLLNLRETQQAVKFIKDRFEAELAAALNLERVSAPLFVQTQSGLNDNLNGVERPVSFDVKGMEGEMQVVQSLAKWKRAALKRYKMKAGQGLYTDMNAIRRDEEVDNLHSYYVDQWDWEKVITPGDQNEDYLKQTVRSIFSALRMVQQQVAASFPAVVADLGEDLTFLTSQELEDRYPDLCPRARENAIVKECGSVFLMQIGDQLKNGRKHDGRAPDYDDWSLNGDLLVYNSVLDCAFELSSMGIRVDGDTLISQLYKANCPERMDLPFHSALIAGKLPLTIGGGIGQSRICMLLLKKAHIGEVQASVWPDQMIEKCSQHGIDLL